MDEPVAKPVYRVVWEAKMNLGFFVSRVIMPASNKDVSMTSMMCFRKSRMKEMMFMISF